MPNNMDLSPEEIKLIEKFRAKKALEAELMLTVDERRALHQLTKALESNKRVTDHLLNFCEVMVEDHTFEENFEAKSATLYKRFYAVLNTLGARCMVWERKDQGEILDEVIMVMQELDYRIYGDPCYIENEDAYGIIMLPAKHKAQ